MPPRRGTPWASSRGSLISDRIRPSGQSQPAKPEKGQGKGKGRGGNAAAPEPLLSTAVRRLDELISGLTATTTAVATATTPGVTVDRDACFCQARAHALSEYTPICTSCGLVLCAQHPPYRACPHCGAPLLSPPARNMLVAQLEELRARTLVEEDEEREREAEALRLAEGAFPVLGGSGAAPSGGSTTGGEGKGKGGGVGAGSGAGHRVLSIDSRTKRVRVESYGGFSRGTEYGDGDEEEQVEGDGFDAPVSNVPPPPRES